MSVHSRSRADSDWSIQILLHVGTIDVAYSAGILLLLPPKLFLLPSVCLSIHSLLFFFRMNSGSGAVYHNGSAIWSKNGNINQFIGRLVMTLCCFSMSGHLCVAFFRLHLFCCCQSVFTEVAYLLLSVSSTFWNLYSEFHYSKNVKESHNCIWPIFFFRKGASNAISRFQ